MSGGSKKASGTFIPQTGLHVPFTPKKPSIHLEDGSRGKMTAKESPAEGFVGNGTSSPLHLGSALHLNPARSALHLGSALLPIASSKELKGLAASAAAAKPRPNAWKLEERGVVVRSRSVYEEEHTNDRQKIPDSPDYSSPKCNSTKDAPVEKLALNNKAGALARSRGHSAPRQSLSTPPDDPSGGDRPLARHSHVQTCQLQRTPGESAEDFFGPECPSAHRHQEGTNYEHTASEGIMTSNLPPAFPQNACSIEIPLLICSDYAKTFGECPLGPQCPKIHVILLPTLSSQYSIPGLELLPSIVPFETIKKYYSAATNFSVPENAGNIGKSANIGDTGNIENSKTAGNNGQFVKIGKIGSPGGAKNSGDFVKKQPTASSPNLNKGLDAEGPLEPVIDDKHAGRAGQKYRNFRRSELAANGDARQHQLVGKVLHSAGDHNSSSMGKEKEKGKGKKSSGKEKDPSSTSATTSATTTREIGKKTSSARTSAATNAAKSAANNDAASGARGGAANGLQKIGLQKIKADYNSKNLPKQIQTFNPSSFVKVEMRKHLGSDNWRKRDQVKEA